MTWIPHATETRTLICALIWSRASGWTAEQLLSPTKIVPFLQTIKSMWWCWANRMMVLGKKWWKTNPIEVFAYQTRSFLRMKIACSHNNGDMIPMNQHLRRRILAPETRTPLASNLCATSPCEKCGERCPRQWEWKIHGKIHRNLFRLFPELTFNRLWFLVSIESQTRWEASESRGLDLYHVLAWCLRHPAQPRRNVQFRAV